MTKLAFNPSDHSQFVSGSEDGTTRFWDMATGQAVSVLEGETFEFAKASATQRSVGRYIVTAKRDLLRICKAPQNAEAPDDNMAPVAFFRAPGDISAIDCAGDSIGVGCEYGDVLLLRARLLVEGA